MVRLRDRVRTTASGFFRMPQHAEDREVAMTAQPGVVDDHVCGDLAVHGTILRPQRRAAFRWS